MSFWRKQFPNKSVLIFPQIFLLLNAHCMQMKEFLDLTNTAIDYFHGVGNNQQQQKKINK